MIPVSIVKETTYKIDDYSIAILNTFYAIRIQHSSNQKDPFEAHVDMTKEVFVKLASLALEELGYKITTPLSKSKL